MEYEKASFDKLLVVGISVRTKNLNNQAQRDISQLWGRFFINNIADTIPNKISDDIYCIYTDYESDYMGEYTTILGCLVSSVGTLSEDMIVKEIPKCDYLKFISEGKIPEVVAQTWESIWQSNIERGYITDFDIYGIAAQNPENAIVTTYVSIK